MPNGLVPPGGPRIRPEDLARQSEAAIRQSPSSAMVLASADPANRIAIYGESGPNIGVWGRSESNTGIVAETNNAAVPALEARSLKVDGKAAKFDGDVYVTGTLKVERDIHVTGTITVARDIVLLAAGDIC